jgi:GTP-binding protein
MYTRHFHQARYLLSAHSLSQLPPDVGGEVAFAGRSNTGKSSVINTLTRQKALAKTSKTPGRTQQINFFILDQWSRLVDLPGYGYARVPEATKRHWAEILTAYLVQRKSLRGLVLIVDIRRGLLEFDLQLLAWACDYEVPVHVLLNKSDKLSRQAAARALGAVRQLLDARGGSGTSLQLFSALKKTGVEMLEITLNQWLEGSGPPG